MNPYVLSEMTWPEVQAALEEVRLAVIPMGSHEQHGPGQTLGTDTYRAFEFSKLLGARLHPRVLVCPPVPVGLSQHHMTFAGTLSLRPETLMDVIVDIAASLKHHGLSQILLLNGHGGNRAALTLVLNRLRFDLGLRAAWVGCMSDMARDLITRCIDSEVWGHGDEVEVSQSLYLAPWCVRTEALAKGELLDSPYGRREWWGVVPWSFGEITANGALGNAAEASESFGEQLTETVLARTIEFIKEYYSGFED